MTNNYSKKILARLEHQEYFGEISQEEAEALGARLLVAEYESNNDDSIKLYWAVDRNTNIILDARFKSFSKGTLLALNDMMTQLCINQSVEKASKITKTDVEFALRDSPELPAMQIKELYEICTNFVILKKIALACEKLELSSFADDYIVCDCARVSFKDIKDAINEFDLSSIEGIQNKTNAGIFCKSCIEEGGLESKEIYLKDIVDNISEIKDNKEEKESKELDFKNITKEEKLRLIENVLDEDIRPMLVMDGGNMEILDLVDSHPHYDLYIRYLGACSGCSSGSMGTLYAIESILQGKVSENIRVLPI